MWVDLDDVFYQLRALIFPTFEPDFDNTEQFLKKSQDRNIGLIPS